jgi:hypothetical protein
MSKSAEDGLENDRNEGHKRIGGGCADQIGAKEFIAMVDSRRLNQLGPLRFVHHLALFVTFGEDFRDVHADGNAGGLPQIHLTILPNHDDPPASRCRQTMARKV